MNRLLGALTVSVLGLPATVSDPPPPPPSSKISSQFTTQPQGGAVETLGDWSQWQAGSEASEAARPFVALATVWESMNAMACMEVSGRWVPAAEDGGCLSGVPQTAALDCGGREWVEPLWQRYRVPPATDWSGMLQPPSDALRHLWRR